MKVGFIGLGIMGKPMCKNLMKAGYEMVVTTHNKETLKEMEALGAKTVTCGREVAEEADVIITMLPNSPQVREVALGEGGIIEGGKEGSVLIDMSSIDPTESKAISAELAKKGIDMLDAPVSGGEPKAIDGTISVMVGGKKETFDKYYDLMMAGFRHDINEHLSFIFFCERLMVLDLSTLYADLCQCADDHVLCFCFCFNGKTIPLHIF